MPVEDLIRRQFPRAPPTSFPGPLSYFRGQEEERPWE